MTILGKLSLLVDHLIWGRFDARYDKRCVVCRKNNAEEHTIKAGNPPVEIQLRICDPCTRRYAPRPSRNYKLSTQSLQLESNPAGGHGGESTSP